MAFDDADIVEFDPALSTWELALDASAASLEVGVDVDTLSGGELQDIDLDTVPDDRDNCAEEANAYQRDTDADGNGLVDPFDLSILKSFVGMPPGPARSRH